MKYSKLPRIYIKTELTIGDTISLDKDNYNYIKNVMRLKNGFNLRVFNERDGEFTSIFDQNGSIVIKEKFRDILDVRNITLLAPIIKQDKLELMCDMATQIGVSRIISIITERVQKKKVNSGRLKKILLEATIQCERFDIPTLETPIELKDIPSLVFDQIFFANETEKDVAAIPMINSKIAVLIGPEGGFSDSELEYLNKLPNIVSLSLGTNVLRTETAAITLLSKLII